METSRGSKAHSLLRTSARTSLVRLRSMATVVPREQGSNQGQPCYNVTENCNSGIFRSLQFSVKFPKNTHPSYRDMWKILDGWSFGSGAKNKLQKVNYRQPKLEISSKNYEMVNFGQVLKGPISDRMGTWINNVCLFCSLIVAKVIGRCVAVRATHELQHLVHHARPSFRLPRRFCAGRGQALAELVLRNRQGWQRLKDSKTASPNCSFLPTHYPFLSLLLVKPGSLCSKLRHRRGT